MHVKPSNNKITLADKFFTIGSCFSDEIGEKLAENKFLTSQNPFGTVYNPISIHHLLLLGLNKQFPSAWSYAVNEDIHFNYHFHSSFSALSRNEIENSIQKSISNANEFLSIATRVVITYGTSFVYRLKSNREIAANCHKMPSALFEKELLTESDIVKSFEGFYSKLKSVNPSAKVILTVSPVRHLKDTLELNAVSKSTLRMACHALISKFPDVEYFPAYEILLDDLRDYRFYKTDRIHPTEEAVEYIWGKFIDAHFNEQTKKFISEWSKIKNDLAHRPFQPGSEKHQIFLKSLLKRLETFHSVVDVSKEISNLKLQTTNESKMEKPES